MARNHLITGLDIGTSAIKILVAQKKQREENLEVLSFVREASFGIRKGVVVDPNGVSQVLSLAFEKNKSSFHQKIDSVYVNVGGSHISSTTSRGLVSVSRADQKISSEDIERVLRAAQTFSLPANREILEVFPQEFIIDGERGIKEALGLQGVRLEAEVLVLYGFTPYLKNLTQSILNSGLSIADLIVSPLASARAVLTQKEKELGVVLLDIGAGTTGLAVFEEGNLVYASILPIGSGHITNDIAVFFKTDFEIAERLKLEFGTCLFHGPDKKEKIEFGEEEPLIFSRKKLSQIIEDRVAEIFGEVQKELKKISRTALPTGVVLTGGGAKLPKIKELAKKELKLNCRIGKPQGFFPEQDDPQLATVCGLVLRGVDLEAETPSLSFKQGIGSRIKKIFKIFLP